MFDLGCIIGYVGDVPSRIVLPTNSFGDQSFSGASQFLKKAKAEVASLLSLASLACNLPWN